VVGTEHLSNVRETYLKKLAEKSYMQYYHLQTSEKLVQTLQHSQYADKQTVATHFNHWFGGLSLLCLLLSFMTGYVDIIRKNSH
jgi:1,2-phenylacetyl-CoA epoxidase catalytic subunit